MLLQLEIKNFAIIDHTIINFEQGFNVLTGETGAGKSILMDALLAILGERTSKEFIRKNCDRSDLKAVFTKTPAVEKQLNAYGIDISDDVIILERQITKSGRNISKINGSIQTTQTMKEIASLFIEICGQKEHQQLLKENYYVWLLDELAGEEQKKTLKEYQEKYRRYKEIEKKLSNVHEQQREQEQLLDLYTFQKKEIEEAHLKLGEEEEMLQEKSVLASFEKISQSVSSAIHQMDAIDQLYEAHKSLTDASKYDEKIVSLNERLEKVYYELQDIKSETENYFEQMEYDEERLNELIDRLELYKTLKRKYGDTTEDILRYLGEISKKIDEIENNEENMEKLQIEKEAIQQSLEQLSFILHNNRINVAKTQGEKINQEIHELCMPHAMLTFEVEQTEGFHSLGKSKINALFSANKGEDVKPLSKVASGGELSRVLLAIKIATKVQDEKVYFFDEVDEGVGGEAGRVIGEKLLKLGETTQVLAISHLPQVAAKGNEHFVIQKFSKEERTFSHVKKLTFEERKNEIARMIYGEHADDITLKQAEGMLKK